MNLLLVAIFASVVFGLLTPRSTRQLNLGTLGIALAIALLFFSNPWKYV